MGIFYAVLSSLFFAFYAVFKKKSTIKPYVYVLFMGLSCFFISLLIYLFLGYKENIFEKWLLFSFIGGIIWYIASVFFFVSVDKIGVARASEFKSLQGPIGSILILTILSEYVSLNIYLLVIAILFIFLSALCLVIKEKNNTKIKVKYILIAVLSALFYGISGFIRKLVTLKGYVYIQQVYSSLGLLLISFIYLLIKDKKLKVSKQNKKDYLLALSSGALYYFASFFMLLSYKRMEGSIAFTIIQLNSIWTAFIGIFYFKEIDYKKHYKRLLLGLLFAIIGITLLVICS